LLPPLFFFLAMLIQCTIQNSQRSDGRLKQVNWMWMWM
jgi:hypothetical protein